MKAYSLAPGWKIFIIIFCIIIMGAGVAGFIYAFFHSTDPTATMLVGTASGFAIIAGIWMIVETIVSKIILGEDYIKSITLFTKRELLFSQIKGYTQDENYIYLAPVSNDLKRIKVYIFMGINRELRQWIERRYNNLTLSMADQTMREVMSDERYGSGQKERELLFEKARRDATAVNIACCAAAGGIFIPQVSLYAMILAMIAPWIAIAYMYYYKGLIAIDTYKGSPLPSLFLAVSAPAFILFIFRGININVLDTTNIWLPAIAIGLLMALFLVITAIRGALSSNRAATWAAGFLYLFIIPAYSYGTVLSLNTCFDNSSPAYFETEVLFKRVSKGKSTSYHLQLAPWGPVHNTEDVRVDKNFYFRTDLNSKVGIALKKGWLDIPWFTVGDVERSF